MFNRRQFLRQGIATATTVSLTAQSYARVLGANDRIGVGFIGYGLIGKRHVADFKREQDVALVAVSDVHRGRQAEGCAHCGDHAQGYTDFRRLLDDRRVDAVVISTPDHWHALQTILACVAGKDVYVEKPLTLFQREGRWMIDVAKRTGRVVQVGTQQRSGRHYQRARELIRAGQLGKIHAVQTHTFRNLGAGFAKVADASPPAELDWELWLGPAPARPYNLMRALYHFRWYWDYSGGQMTNLGAHHFDIVDWIVGLNGLKSVASFGGRLAIDDGGETPDTQEAIFDCGKFVMSFSLREASRGETRSHGLNFFGTNGQLGLSRSGFTVTPDTVTPAENMVPGVGGHPVGGPEKRATSGVKQLRTEAINDTSGNSDEQYFGHVRNFLDSIRSRATPIADLTSGHRTSTACHLANMALRLGRQLRWDAEQETIVGDAEAQAMLERPYRQPWDRELKACLR